MTIRRPTCPEGERANACASPHPVGLQVRKAAFMAGIDRPFVSKSGNGPSRPCKPVTCPRPRSFTHSGQHMKCLTQDLESAKALLEEAGWTDTDGDASGQRR